MAPFKKRLETWITWTEIANHYWQVHLGELRNQKEFWDNTLHAMPVEDWQSWCEIAPALAVQRQMEWQRYPQLAADTREVERRLLLGKPIVRQHRMGANLVAFRLFMNIKDFFNDCADQPTRHYTQSERELARTLARESKNPYHTLFEEVL